MGRTAEVMRFEMPFQADPPAVLSEPLGITWLLERQATSHRIDVTVLDTPDARLLRAGVTLAHRVLAGVGTWYLAAPGWKPLLPAERVVPVSGRGELPPEFVQLTRPIARRAPLAPIATLTCRRVDYQLHGPDGVLADIRDERVTVSRDEQTTEYREATITPTTQLTAPQRRFVHDAMNAVDATRLEHFPSLAQRLGPPATGGTDFPEAGPLRREASMEEFAAHVFAKDLRLLVEAIYSDTRAVDKALSQVHHHVRGLANVLDPGWLATVESALTGPSEAAALDVLDALVSAARAPRLGDVSAEPAAELLLRRSKRGAYILADRCRSLTTDSPDQDWRAASAAAEQLRSNGKVVVMLQGKRGHKLLGRVNKLTKALRSCAVPVEVPGLADLSPEEAFECGRAVERQHQRIGSARRKFVARWPKRMADVRRLAAKGSR
ncbi:MAG: hypothetical protein Q4D79_06485 [Propionibacteriaceae bacterium]|nr:hypothetical protein [Propionibacteriaceae bacterium]